MRRFPLLLSFFEIILLPRGAVCWGAVLATAQSTTNIQQKACEKLLANVSPYIEKANGAWDEAVTAAFMDKVTLQYSETIV